MVQADACIKIESLGFLVHRHDCTANIYSTMNLASDNLRM